MRFLILLLLAGCAATRPDGAIPIVWHKLDKPITKLERCGNDICEAVVNGKYRIIDGVCHVWALDPPVKIVNGRRVFDLGQWATLGHEVKHCFDGKFHD